MSGTPSSKPRLPPRHPGPKPWEVLWTCFGCKCDINGTTNLNKNAFLAACLFLLRELRTVVCKLSREEVDSRANHNSVTRAQ